MTSKIRRSLFLILTIIVLLFTSVIASYGESAQYVYDELNRLTKEGTFVQNVHSIPA
jgi:hypothetical protein